MKDRSARAQFGPLTVNFADGKSFVSVEPSAATSRRLWRLAFEMDVAEALDVLMAAHPNDEIVPEGWTPSKALCPFVWGKLQIMAMAWAKRGRYPQI